VTWNNANDDAEPPEVVREDIGGARFVNDRMAMTLAFVPESKIGEIPRPDSIPQLDQLTDIEPIPGATTTVADATGTTVDATGTTTEAGGTASTLTGEPSTTVAGSTGSTAGGAASSTTAAGSTTTG
jgi:hypothetical protein